MSRAHCVYKTSYSTLICSPQTTPVALPYSYYSRKSEGQTTNILRDGGEKSYFMEWRQDRLRRYAAAGINLKVGGEETFPGALARGRQQQKRKGWGILHQEISAPSFQEIVPRLRRRGREGGPAVHHTVAPTQVGFSGGTLESANMAPLVPYLERMAGVFFFIR